MKKQEQKPLHRNLFYTELFLFNTLEEELIFDKIKTQVWLNYITTECTANNMLFFQFPFPTASLLDMWLKEAEIVSSISNMIGMSDLET
jgi:hypothetical protein